MKISRPTLSAVLADVTALAGVMAGAAGAPRWIVLSGVFLGGLASLLAHVFAPAAPPPGGAS